MTLASPDFSMKGLILARSSSWLILDRAYPQIWTSAGSRSAANK